MAFGLFFANIIVIGNYTQGANLDNSLSVSGSLKGRYGTTVTGR